MGQAAFEKLVAPTIALARDGVRLTADKAFVYQWCRARLLKSAAGKAAFYTADGSLYRNYEVIKRP